MFPTILNRDFLLDDDGKVVLTPLTKDITLPDMPPLIYISDLKYKLCLDTHHNLYNFDNDKLTLLKEGVRQIVQSHNFAYIITFDNELYSYNVNTKELKLLQSDVSYIFTMYNVFSQIEYGVVTLTGNYFGLRKDKLSDEMFDNKFPLLEDIKLIRNCCLITNNNTLHIYELQYDCIAENIIPYTLNFIDIYYCINTNTESETLYALTNSLELYQCKINTSVVFTKVNNPVLNDIGIIQFIYINNMHNMVIFQTNKGYIATLNDHNVKPLMNLLPNSYIPPFNRNRYNTTKKALNI